MKIDKNIPIPKRIYYIETIKRMEVGDSVLIEGRNHANNLKASALRYGIITTSAREGDKFRIWVTEKKAIIPPITRNHNRNKSFLVPTATGEKVRYIPAPR